MEIHDDDKPVGRILSRREMLTLLGGTGTALFAGLALPKIVIAQTATPSASDLPTCVVKPELTEGPYFVDDQLNRIDIRTEPSDGSIKAGIPLHLIYRVSDVTNGTCLPLQGAQVDIWHCDAEGEYSGVQDQGFDTSEEMWLRGYQVTDEFGKAEFLTIVPGWYSGRAVHIHFKIRTVGTDGESYEFTSQLFFDPEQIEELYQQAPYAAKGSPDTPNETDNIFQSSGDVLTLELALMEDEEMEDLRQKIEDLELTSGYTAIFDVGLDLSDTSVGASDSAGGGGGFGGGRGGNPPSGRP